MQNRLISESIEMYLKALAELETREPVAISRLAARLGVTQVSATEMVKRLAEQNWLTHLPYKGVLLTEKGKEIAYDVIRRQRLWECFLYIHLKIEWARVYELACNLEHATAPEVTEALAAFLGNPSVCPRGNPIPAADGSFTPLNGIPLSGAKIGQKAQVLAVQASDVDVLAYLQARHILPGRQIQVLAAAPLQGPLTIQIEEYQAEIGLQVAELITIQPSEEPA
jgi:DtxR family transcriptional regulator, Mn-dependent transcriptional regulator